MGAESSFDARRQVRFRHVRARLSRTTGTITLLLLLGVVTACGTAPAPAVPAAVAPTAAAPAGSAAPAGTTTVVMRNFLFAPDTITVPAGATVTVVNQDGAIHTLTANDGSFDTGRIAGRATGTFTAPSKPGTYPYKCAVHPFMTGTLTVT